MITCVGRRVVRWGHNDESMDIPIPLKTCSGNLQASTHREYLLELRDFQAEVGLWLVAQLTSAHLDLHDMRKEYVNRAGV